MLADFHERARKLRATSRLSTRLRGLKDDITHTMELYREKNRRIELDKSRETQRERLQEISTEARTLHDDLQYADYFTQEPARRRLRELSQEVGKMYYGDIHPDLIELYENTVELVNTSFYARRSF